LITLASTFPLDIVTPERTILSETVTSLQLPAADGSLGILAGHAPLVAALGAGECVVRTASGAEETLAIAGGFVEVTRQRVTVLADNAEFAHEINVDHAEEALASARQMLAGLDAESTGSDREAANDAIQREQARLRVARANN
jgi:F-type H+-transporting ATPase subunit epsilon